MAPNHASADSVSWLTMTVVAKIITSNHMTEIIIQRVFTYQSSQMNGKRGG
jgi:hypothetical protein